MSVINQMLVDLEERRAADGPAIQARQTAHIAAGVTRRPRRMPRAIAWGIVALILGAVAYAAIRGGYDSGLFSLLSRAVSSAVASTRAEAVAVAPAPADNERPATPVSTGLATGPDPDPIDVIEQTAEFEPAVVAIVARVRTPNDGPAKKTTERKRPAASAAGNAEKQHREAAPASTTPVAVATPPPQPAVRKKPEPVVSEPAGPRPKKTRVEPAPQVRKVPRQPSPQERFARFLADARYALARDDMAKARALVHQALHLAPGNAAAEELLLAVQMRSGDTRAAMQTLRAALRRDPRNAAYARALARLLAAHGEDREAIGYLRAALANGQADGQSLALLAGLERRIGDHESAAAHYVDALAQDRTMAVWWLGLGMSLESLEQREEARAAFGEAQRLGGLDDDVAAFVEKRLARLNAASAR